MVFRGERTNLGEFNGFRKYASISYFCTTCGELWGRLVFSETGIHAVSCSKCNLHGGIFAPGGSFYKTLLWWEFDSNEKLLHQRLPRELALHEAMMLINHAEKGLRLL